MTIRAIIPCCGFGTRMAMHPNQSKELLLDPVTNQPIIQWWIDVCKEYNIGPLVLVREEKQDLIDYCKSNNIDYVVMTPGKEWAATVRASYNHWSDKNILLLPDTRYKPKEAIQKVLDGLDEHVMSFGVFDVDDSSKWCVIDKMGIWEKAQRATPFKAIGLFAFWRESGKVFFDDIANNGHHRSLTSYTTTVDMDSFVDLTRTGNIEKY